VYLSLNFSTIFNSKLLNYLKCYLKTLFFCTHPQSQLHFKYYCRLSFFVRHTSSQFAVRSFSSHFVTLYRQFVVTSLSHFVVTLCRRSSSPHVFRIFRAVYRIFRAVFWINPVAPLTLILIGLGNLEVLLIVTKASESYWTCVDALDRALHTLTTKG
jgi:hypothetical protein